MFMAVFMTYRFFKTSKFMPAGLMAILRYVFCMLRIILYMADGRQLIEEETIVMWIMCFN